MAHKCNVSNILIQTGKYWWKTKPVYRSFCTVCGHVGPGRDDKNRVVLDYFDDCMMEPDTTVLDEFEIVASDKLMRV